jgi:hypothetical protein
LEARTELTKVNESRNTNAPLSITVLCACLGLLIIGVPAETNARQVATEIAHHYGASPSRLSLSASVVSSLHTLKVDDRWLPDSAVQTKGQPKVSLYQNTKALSDKTQVLLITHLPRATLSEQPAKPPTQAEQD